MVVLIGLCLGVKILCCKHLMYVFQILVNKNKTDP